MKFAFSTLGCPKWSLKQIAEFSAGAGYDAVELRVHSEGVHMSESSTVENAKQIKNIFSEHGVRIFSLKTYCKFGSHLPEELSANRDKLLHLLKLASTVGAMYVRIFGGLFTKHKDEKQAISDVISYLTPCAKRATELGVIIGLETHDDWCRRLKGLVEIVRETGTGTGIVWDFVNVFFGADIDIATQYETIHKYLTYCHVKDAVRDSTGKVKPVSFGTGNAPLREFVDVLKKDNRDIYLSYEHEKMWHPELPEPELEFPVYLKQIRQLLK